MKKIAVLAIMLPLLASLILLQGCNGNLSRRQAKKQIDATLQPHEVGPKKIKVQGGVPGFALQDGDDGRGYFHLDERAAYGELDFQKAVGFPENEEFLLDALSHLGYVHIQEEGPKTELSGGIALRYKKSRTVTPTAKMGSFTTDGNARVYSVGFRCYPAPKYAQCNIPELIEIDKKGYTITGIVQDGTHAKVSILIPWKLTPFGLELKPYANGVSEAADKFGSPENGIATYYTYPSLYSWAHLLNSHEASGSVPATILFQKFDDGWRIVDEQGHSEQDIVQ